MAIFTTVSFDQAAKFIDNYNIGKLVELVPIESGVENTNYKLITNQASYILTLFEKRTPEEALPFVFRALGHLAGKKLPVAQPLASNNGELLSKLNGRPAAIVNFLNGRSVEQPNESQCKAVGVFLADLHLASNDFSAQRQNPFGLDSFEQFFNNISENLDEIEIDLGSFISEEITYLNTHKPSNIPTGLIHADLFPDNVLFNDHSQISGVIDFYYAAIDSFAYDLAITINCWAGMSNGELDMDKSKALLAGYQSKRKLLKDEKTAMNEMFRMASMRFLLSRSNDWFSSNPDQEVAKKDPLEYVTKLRFHQRQKCYEGFGF